MSGTLDAVIPAATAPLRSPTWVRGPVWDGVWMLNAIWLVPVALWLAHGNSNPEAGPLDAFYFGLTALFWIGHRLSSSWLAYCTEAYRPLIRRQPVRFVLLPLLVLVACFDGGPFYGDRIFGAAAEQLRSTFWAPALVAVGFATGFVHYLLDRCVFRMSDPLVRTAARGLLETPCK